jgi:hypothetical protein
VYDSTTKSKMISFRLSGEEYRLLQRACGKCGARNLSELVRTAMQRIILEDDTSRPASPEDELRDFKAKFHMLAAEVKRLSRIVKGSE